ncbi:MAG: twin-arginine translocase subunit TatC [Firmicutes bacterium]|nr:twin-arginine translocase subunit TatC [Bacillota bacterium]
MTQRTARPTSDQSLAEGPEGGLIAERPDGTMTIVEHLGELRRRIIVSSAATAVGSVGGYLLAPRVVRILGRSVGRLIFVAPAEGFFTYLKIALMIGLVFASPVVLSEIWRFVLPGLTRREERYLRRYVPLIILLFLLGVVFAYLVIYPIALSFFLGFGTMRLKPVMAVGRLVGFVLSLLIPFGLMFELPVVVVILIKLGIIDLNFLLRHRKHAYFWAFVLGAVLTPPDVVSQVLMAAPMIALFEIGVLVARFTRKGMPNG